VAWLEFNLIPYVERDVASFDPEENAMPAQHPQEGVVPAPEQIGASGIDTFPTAI